MENNLPLVSIGLPVYNGQNYLEQAINSVLDQTYKNFEVIISDNGSRDKTRSICEHYAKKDKRIKYFRLDKNYGAAKNYNRTFEISSGKYFKWLAHDDILAPTNISKSVKILEAENEVVLCGSRKENINAYGKTIDQYGYKNLALNQDDPVERYNLFLKYFASTFANADFVFGLIRSDQLKNSHLIGNYTSADFTLLADLILKGKFYVIDEPLFLRRIHQGISMSVNNDKQQNAEDVDPSLNIVYKNHAQVAKWYDPNGKVRYIPHFKWLSELINSIAKNGFRGREKIRLFLFSYRWFFNRSLISIKDNFQKRILTKITNKNEGRNISWRPWHKVG